MLGAVTGSRRFVFVSDSHLSPRAPESGQNWSAVLGYVESAEPDLVVHVGDLSLNGARDEADLAYGRARLDLLGVPWLAVPGNHDVGDNPTGAGPDQHGIDAQSRQRWLAAVGPDWWATGVDGWRLIGINAQLFGSELAAEAEQWAWLESELAAVPPASRVALVTHKPITDDESALSTGPAYRYVPAPARDRLAALLRRRPADVVISGHIHQYRESHRDGTTYLWVPTTWAVLADWAQAVVGVKRSGILAVEFTGTGEVRHEFVVPDGLGQFTIGADIANPYH